MANAHSKCRILRKLPNEIEVKEIQSFSNHYASWTNVRMAFNNDWCTDRSIRFSLVAAVTVPLADINLVFPCKHTQAANIISWIFIYHTHQAFSLEYSMALLSKPIAGETGYSTHNTACIMLLLFNLFLIVINEISPDWVEDKPGAFDQRFDSMYVTHDSLKDKSFS